MLGPSGACTSTASTILSSGEASAIYLPSCIGDVILFQWGQSLHMSGLLSLNTAQVYGPLISDALRSVASNEYSGWRLDMLCMPLSGSSQNLAIDNPARHKGSEQAG